MAKATAEVTVYHSKSVKAVYRYYLLQSTKPSKPTTFPPATTWISTEPTYTEGSTDNLYFVDCTVLSDGSFVYSDVSISTAYEASKVAYNRANETASTLAQWCAENDKTLINGAKIYTGSITAEQIAANSITADKLSVTSLEAIVAKIGGFNIGSKALYNGIASISSTKAGVYLGNDGIKTADEDGWTTIVGNRIVTGWSDSDNHVDVYAHGIDLQSFGETIDIYPQRIQFYNDEAEYLMINYEGIYDARWNTAEPMLGIHLEETGVTVLGQDTRLYGSLHMGSVGNIGTIAYPTGSHVMANDKYLYGLNSDGGRERLIGITDSDNMVIGSSAVKKGNIFTYINTEGSYSVSDGVGYIFGTYVSEEDNGRYFRAVPVYEQTTTGGTAVRVGGTGLLYRYTSSSMRYKEEITQKLDDELNPERLYDLGVYQYKYRDGYISEHDQRYGKLHIGLLAEDVKHKYPIAVNYNDDGQAEDWSERYIIPAMLKLIQNQNKEIQNIKAILKGESI